MSDKVQATPPQGGQWMLKLAEALRGAAERAAPALDIPGLPLFGETYRSLARGVENWAYGDSPIDTRANTPLVNDRTADMAGALPVGTALNASKASLLIPIIRGRNADKLAEANLLKRAELADQIKAQGATRGDIWHDAQVSEVIRPTNRGRAFDNGKWLHELETPKDLFSPYASMAENDKIDLLARPENIMFAERLRKAPAGWPEARMYQNVFDNVAPVPGTGYKVGDVVDWPELGAQYPEILDTNLDVMPKGGKPMKGGSRGSYYPSENRIVINPRTLVENPDSIGSPRGNLLHEVTHGIQEKFGMPGGGSEGFWDPQRQMYMMDVVNELRALQQTGARKDYEDAGILIRQLYPQANRGSFAQYENLMGEAQARAASTRDLRSPSVRKVEEPLEAYDASRGLVDPDLWSQAMGNAALGTRTDKAASNLVNWLRRKYPHTP